MSEANKAAIMHGINDLRVQEWPVPSSVAPGHVRVAMKAVGICATDVHFLQHGRIGDFAVRSPMVLGHESSGVVHALGEGVQHLKVGDAVALEPAIPCWHGSAAREGRYNLDPDIRCFATPPTHGSLATFVDHPEELCYKLPAGMSFEAGAMCEPLSVAVHACRRAGVQPGKSVAVLGAGPMGLVMLMTVQAYGADQIVITDIRQAPLNFAQQHYQPVHTLLTKPSESPTTVAQALQQAFANAVDSSTPGPATAAALQSAPAIPARSAKAAGSTSSPSTDDEGMMKMVKDRASDRPQSGGLAQQSSCGLALRPSGLDIVIDCCGVQQTLEAAIRAVKPGGKVVLVGVMAEEVKVPATLITCKEIDVLGCLRYVNTYPLCLSLIASRRVNVQPLITHRFKFTPSGVAEGFDTAATAKQTGAIKVMFNLD